MKHIDKIDKYTSQNFSNILLRVKDMVTNDRKKEDILKYINGFIHQDSMEIKNIKRAFDHIYIFINNRYDYNVITKENGRKSEFLKYYIQPINGSNKYHSSITNNPNYKHFLTLIEKLEKVCDVNKSNIELKKILLLSKILLDFCKFLLDTIDDRIEIYTKLNISPSEKSARLDNLDTLGRTQDDESKYLREINRRFQKQVKILLEKE